MKRVIFHIDVNSAFLSWEAVYRLYHLGGKVDLRGEVAAVGGDMAMRHGRDSMMRAAFVGSRIDHMSGGISREKRNVDYGKLKVE